MKHFLSPLFCLCLLTGISLANPSPPFFATPAKPGDGITILLQRYELHSHPCNLTKFLELNNLKNNAPLIQGKEYKLPIFIYTYNGKSIRSTIGIDDMDAAKRIAHYNKVILNRNLRQSDYVTSKILWVPYHELNCSGESANTTASTSSKNPSTKTPSGTSAHYFPIFGPDYATVVPKSDKLKGKVYYISSGHGGPDPGAVAKVGNQTICEDEYAYDVSLRLARNLIEQGAKVYIIVQDENDGIRNEDILLCDNDEKMLGKETIPINQLARLKQRTDAINDIYAGYARKGIKEQILVCIHVDSRSEHQRQDVFFYHFEHSKSGKKLALNVQKVFEEKYARYRATGGYEGTVSTRNLYMLRKPFPTTLYVELANIKNAFDRKRILPATNRQALANWLFEGLTK